MNSSKSRILFWTGPVFAVLFIVLGFLTGDTPGEKSSGQKLINYFDDHKNALMASVFLSALACALLIVFAAQVRVRARESGQNLAGPSVMVGGAVLWSAGLLTGSMITLAQVDASDRKNPDASVTLNYLANASWLPFIAGIAVFLIGAGMTALSTRIVPAWLGWLALVVGIVSLAGPGGFVGFFGGPLWLLIAGVYLATRSDSTATQNTRVPAAV
jgi:hypothetical protein